MNQIFTFIGSHMLVEKAAQEASQKANQFIATSQAKVLSAMPAIASSSNAFTTYTILLIVEATEEMIERVFDEERIRQNVEEFVEADLAPEFYNQTKTTQSSQNEKSNRPTYEQLIEAFGPIDEN